MSKRKSTATRRTQSQAAAQRAAAIRHEHERRERRRQTLLVTVVGIVVLALVVLVTTLVSASRDSTGESATPPRGAVGGYAVPSGPSTAPVKVVVYEDFLCPFCGDLEAAGRASFQRDIDAGKVQFQYHVLSFLDEDSTTRYSTRAANALAVALDSSGPRVAKRFHDLLFENQPDEGSAGLSDSRLTDLATQAGASRAEVKPGIDDLAFEPWVKKVTDRSSKDGVRATPTVSIDGTILTAESTEELVTQIEEAVSAGGN
jgi:protein-disulfide isomerase